MGQKVKQEEEKSEYENDLPPSPALKIMSSITHMNLGAIVFLDKDLHQDWSRS